MLGSASLCGTRPYRDMNITTTTGSDHTMAAAQVNRCTGSRSSTRREGLGDTVTAERQDR
jgi:hypothetical protein